MKQMLRVLYAEDSSIDADLTRAHCRLNAPHISLEVVTTGARCLARLHEASFDVLLLDNHLPDMEGIEVLRELAHRKVSLPVVMVTGLGDEALVVQVLRMGASDYVSKEADYLAGLPALLENAVHDYRTQQAQIAAGGRPTRILYAEHNPADVDLTRRHFAEAAPHLDLQVVSSSAEALALLEKESFDVVLADLRLRDLTALDLLREARRRNVRVPFVIVTGGGDEHAAVAAIKLGAYDYIVKRDNYLTQLPYALENAIARSRLLESNQQLQNELTERARLDGRIRQLNADLEQRVVQRTRELEAANEELEDNAVLELIVRNAPLIEIGGRLAALLARRASSTVSVTAFPPSDRFRLGARHGQPANGADDHTHEHVRASSTRLASLAIATPDGAVHSTASVHIADADLVETLAAAERLPSQVDFPIRSAITSAELGRFTLYLDDYRPLEAATRRTVERCTKLAAIALDRAHSEERIRRQALEDPLTALPNRVLWFDRLDQALIAARRYGFVVGVLLYDLDRFKDINDTFGHDVGDRVLRHVAAQLEHAVRPSDTVSRLGGDEFAVVVPRLADLDEAQRIAQRGLEKLEEPLRLDGVVLKPKASVGVAFYPLHAADSTNLLRCADVAMYRTKRLGGGIGTYDVERDHEQLESISFVAELQRGIEGEQLLLCYQPKISLQTGRTVGVECLVRWRHPTRGLIPPLQFIPLAESVGLIKPLSLWVIRRALDECQAWYERGLDIPVAVNLSAPLLYDPQLPGTIRAEMEAHGIREGHLEVEITESTLMLDPERAMKTISALRDNGIAFALDDFGTGYSSLAYLKNLQVQSIKIDQSFVRDMVTDERDASIVKAAIELGHSFNLDIVAEGVESTAVNTLLTMLGCDHAQGFHLAKPMTNTDFLEWYDQQATQGS